MFYILSTERHVGSQKHRYTMSLPETFTFLLPPSFNPSVLHCLSSDFTSQPVSTSVHSFKFLSQAFALQNFVLVCADCGYSGVCQCCWHVFVYWCVAAALASTLFMFHAAFLGLSQLFCTKSKSCYFQGCYICLIHRFLL